MYSVSFLPAALADIENIVRYIAITLENPAASERLAEAIVNAAESLETLPYRHRVYQPLRPLKNEYRVMRVNNYLVFYWVEEEPPRVTIARVLYAKSNVAKRFDDLTL